jgi:hypothetical protein
MWKLGNDNQIVYEFVFDTTSKILTNLFFSYIFRSKKQELHQQTRTKDDYFDFYFNSENEKKYESLIIIILLLLFNNKTGQPQFLPKLIFMIS